MKNKEQILKACEDSKRKDLGGRRQKAGVLGQDEKFALSQMLISSWQRKSL